MLLFEDTNTKNPSLLEMADLPHPTLEKLIKLILLDKPLKLVLEDGRVEKRRVLPVDYIISLNILETYKEMNREKALGRLKNLKAEINLIISLGSRAISQFKKYHPFSFSLSYTEPYQASAILEASIQLNLPEEIDEITNWLLFLGDDIKFKKVPPIIENRLRERVCFFT